MKRERPLDLHSDSTTPPPDTSGYIPTVITDMWRSLTSPAQQIVAINTTPPTEHGNAAKRRAVSRGDIHVMPGHFPSSSPPPSPPPRRRWPTTPSPSPARGADSQKQTRPQIQRNATSTIFSRIYSWMNLTPTAIEPTHDVPTESPLVASHNALSSAARNTPPTTQADHAEPSQSRPAPRRFMSINERLAQLREMEERGETAPEDLRQSYRGTPRRELSPRKIPSPRMTLQGRKSFQQSHNTGLRESTGAVRDLQVDGLLERYKKVTIESAEDRLFRESVRLRKRRLESEKGLAGRRQEREEEERRFLEEERALEEQKQEQQRAQEEEERKAQEEQRALEARRAADEAEREASKHRLVRPLEPKWAAIVEEAMRTTNATKVFSKSPDGSDITRYVLGKILPQEGEREMTATMKTRNAPAGWLNDECVDMWIAMVVARRLEQDGYVKGPNSTPSLAAYLSAYWVNYREKGVQSIAGWSRRKGIKGKKLLGVERIFFPTNTGAHWILIVISPKSRVIEVFDSAGGQGSNFYRFAREWLAMELGQDYNADEWSHGTLRSSQQQNCDDCGVFTCVNALASAKNKAPSDVVSTDGMKDARNMMVAVLINGGFKEDWEL